LIRLADERSKEAANCAEMDEVTRGRFYDRVYTAQRDKRLKDYLAKLRKGADIQVLETP